MQLRSGELALTTGNLANESGVEENRVNSRPATLRRSMRPVNAGREGNWKRQSPHICFALNSQASSRSAIGTRSVENNSDTGLAPVLPDSGCSRLKDIVIPNWQEMWRHANTWPRDVQGQSHQTVGRALEVRISRSAVRRDSPLARAVAPMMRSAGSLG